MDEQGEVTMVKVTMVKMLFAFNDGIPTPGKIAAGIKLTRFLGPLGRFLRGPIR